MSAINQISNINFIINNYSKVIPASNKDNIKDLLEFRNLFDGVRSSTVKVKNTEQDQKKVKDLYEKFAKWFKDNQLNEDKIKETLKQVKNGNNKETFLQGYKLTLFFDFCYRIQDTHKGDFEKTSDQKFKEAGMAKNKDDIDQLVKNYVTKKNENGESIQDELKKIYTVDSNLQNNGIEIFPSLLVRTADVYSQLNKTRSLYTDKNVDSIKEFDKIIDSYLKIINSDNLKSLEKSEEFKQIVSQASIKTELTKFLHQLLQENTSVNFTKSFTDKHLKDYLDAIKSNTEYQHDNIKKSIKNSQTLQVVGEKFFKVESYLDKKTDYDPLAKYNTVVSETISKFNDIAQGLISAGDNFFKAKDSDLTDNAFLQYGCLKLAQDHLAALDKLPKNIVKQDTATLSEIAKNNISKLETKITEMKNYYDDKNLKNVSNFSLEEKEKINTYLQDNKKYWQLFEYLTGISLKTLADLLNREVNEVHKEKDRTVEKESLRNSAEKYREALDSLTPILSDYSKYGLDKKDLPTLSKEIQDILDSDDSNDPENPKLKAALTKLKTALENLLGKMQKKAKDNADKGYGQKSEVQDFDPSIQDAQDFPTKLAEIIDIIDTQSVKKSELDQLSGKIANYKRAYGRLKNVSGNSKYGLAEFVPVLPDTLARAFDQDKNNDPTSEELEIAFSTAKPSIENALSLMKKQAEKNKDYGGDNLDSFNPEIQADAADAAMKIDQIVKIIDGQEIRKVRQEAAKQAEQKRVANNYKNAYDELANVIEKPEYGLSEFPVNLPQEIVNYLDQDDTNDPTSKELEIAFSTAKPNIEKALSLMKKQAEKNKNYGGDNLDSFNPEIQADAADAVSKIKKIIDIIKAQKAKKAEQKAAEQAKLLTKMDGFIKTVDRIPQYNFPVLASMYIQILQTLAAGDLEIEYNVEYDKFFEQMITYLKSWQINAADIKITKPDSKTIRLTCPNTLSILTAVKNIFADFEKVGLVDLLNHFDQLQYKDGKVVANFYSWDNVLNTGRLFETLNLENITEVYACYNKIISDQEKLRQLLPNDAYRLNFERGIKQKLATLSYLLLKNREASLNKQIIDLLKNNNSDQGREFLNLVQTVGIGTAIFEVVKRYNDADEFTKKKWQSVFQEVDLPKFVEMSLKHNIQKLIFNGNFKSILTFDRDKIMPNLDQKDLEEFTEITDKNSKIYKSLDGYVSTYHDPSLKGKINRLAVIYPYILVQLSADNFDFVSNLKILGVNTIQATNANGSRKVTGHFYSNNLIIQTDDLNRVLKIDNVAKNIKLSITKDKLEELGLTAKQIEKYAFVAKQNKEVYVFSDKAKDLIYQDLLKADSQTFNALLKLFNYYQEQAISQPVYLTLDQNKQHYLSYIPMDRDQDVRLDMGQLFDRQRIDRGLREKLGKTIVLSTDQDELKKFNEYFSVAVNKEEFNGLLLELNIFFEAVDNKLYFKKDLLDPQLFNKALSLAGVDSQHPAFAKLSSIRNLYLQRSKFFEFNRQTGELLLKTRPDQREIESLQNFVGKADSPVINAINNFSDYNFLGKDYLTIINQVNDQIFEESSDIRDLLIKDQKSYDPVLDFYTGYYNIKNQKNDDNNALGHNRRIVTLCAFLAFIIAGPIKRGKDRNETIQEIIKIFADHGKQWWGGRMFSETELAVAQELLQQAHLPEYGFSNSFTDQQIIALINCEPEFKSLFSGLLSANRQVIRKVAYHIYDKK